MSNLEKKIKTAAQNSRLKTPAYHTYKLINNIRWVNKWNKPVTFHGKQFIIGKDHSLYPSVKLETFEKDEFNWLLPQIKPKDTIWDIGANIGLYTVLCASSQPNTHVYAFEPYKPTYEKLQTNLKLNNITNVTTKQIAISDQNGEIGFKVNYNTPGCNHIDTTSVTKIQTTTGQTLTENGTPTPDIIKIDVEGHEPEAFKGMKTIIETTKPVILLEINAEKINPQNWETTWNPLIKWLLNTYTTGQWFSNNKQQKITELTYETIQKQTHAASLGLTTRHP